CEHFPQQSIYECSENVRTGKPPRVEGILIPEPFLWTLAVSVFRDFASSTLRSPVSHAPQIPPDRAPVLVLRRGDFLRGLHRGARSRSQSGDGPGRPSAGGANAVRCPR